jgi:hypothetical protein
MHSTGLALAVVTVIAATSPLFSLEVGTDIDNIKIRDADDRPAALPNLGNKVLTLFYTDPDVADQNDSFADALKVKKYPKEKYDGIGIANLKDTWKPNALIRMIIRQKIEKYKSTILTDPELILPSAWNLGSCDDQSVIIIIGRDKKVYYVKKGAMSDSDHKKALSIIDDLISKG